MQFGRVKIASAVVGMFLLASVLHAQTHVELGPMLGHVGPEEARFWLKASGEAEAGVVVGRKADLSDAMLIESEPVPLHESAARMGTIRVEGLEPATPYYYAVTLDGERHTSPPYPSFTTAPPPGGPTSLRIAFSSCAGHEGPLAAAAWGELDARARADLILLLGDNHYADSTDPAVQRDAYYSQRDLAGFRAATARTPTYGIWDDHDYGPNDSDRTAAGKEDSLRTFQEHWANPAYGEPGNPGIYSSFSYGDVQLFLLDDRYHRDPNRARDEGQKTMLGERQKEWLKEGLRASEATFKIIATGSEFQLNGHLDSWTSFDRERRELLDFLREEEITGVIILSGDRHFTGAYQIDGQVIEITAGPLGSRNFPTKNLPDMFLNRGFGRMYCVLELNTKADPPQATIEVYRAGEGQIERRELTWEQINGSERITPLPVGQPGPDELE
jgi:alkaline phosphatase D